MWAFAMPGCAPLHIDVQRVGGPAFTLRSVPGREDRATTAPMACPHVLVDPAARCWDLVLRGADGLWVLHPGAAGDNRPKSVCALTGLTEPGSTPFLSRRPEFDPKRAPRRRSPAGAFWLFPCIVQQRVERSLGPHCVKAVARELGGSVSASDLWVISSEFSQAGTSVTVHVPSAEAPWACVVDRDGSVSRVYYTARG
jgi:hypothetical protein